MELSFIYVPVSNITKAIDFYRDVLGLDEAWREGESTVAFKLPGRDIELMVDADVPGDVKLTPGGFFRVENLDDWLSARPKATLVQSPFPIPGGRAATLADPAGNSLYVFEMVEDPAGS